MANDGTLTPEQIDELNRKLEEQKSILRLLNNEKVQGRQVDAQLYEEASDNMEKYTAKLREHREAVEANKEAVAKFNKAVSESGAMLDSVIPGMSKFTKLFEKGADGSKQLGKNLEELALSLTKSFNNALRETAKGIENVNVALAKQTGFSSALRKDVLALASSHDGLYLSMEESSKVVGALSTGFRMYNAQNKQTRLEVNSLAGRFSVLGADASQTAEVLDQMNVIFGGLTSGAIAATAELENLAIRTGQPLSAVLSDFQQLGPQMARFGVDGVRVFTRLNEQARTLGLTTRQAFDISELFDTFESSADVAGKLNAQLGLQLNSVELMATTAEDRLKILRAEFDMRGMNMQQMGRRQKQMIADILKTDVLTAERLLGDPMEMRKFQRDQENNNERLEQFTSAMDKFSAASEQLFINLAPVIETVMSGVNSFAEVLNHIITSPFGELISKLTLVGSLMGTVYGIARFFGKALKGVVKVVGGIVSGLLLAKDLYQALPMTGTEEETKAARARLKAGAVGAGVGAAAGAKFFGIGAIPGAVAGYGLGREVPGISAEFANDKITSGPALVRTSQGMTRLAAGDTMIAQKDGGELSQLVNLMKELIRVTKAGAERGMTAVLEVDSGEIAKAAFKHVNPVHAV